MPQPVTRNRDLPFSKGSGVCNTLFFIPLTPPKRGTAAAPQGAHNDRAIAKCCNLQPVTRNRALPFSKGLGVCNTLFFIPLTPLKRGTAAAPQGAPNDHAITKCRNLQPVTRSRALPFSKGSGVCNALFFIPLTPLKRGTAAAQQGAPNDRAIAKCRNL